MARLGEAGFFHRRDIAAWLGEAGRGAAGLGKAGFLSPTSHRGLAWLGGAWRGLAWLGEAGFLLVGLGVLKIGDGIIENRQWQWKSGMAGDWIKMFCNLGDSGEVLSLCTATGLDHFQVVGRLHALWSWAYEHSHRGSITLGISDDAARALIDTKVAHVGFAKALESNAVAWLCVTRGVVTFPGFDKHNGEDSKSRAQAALRQKKWRENAEKPKRKNRNATPLRERYAPVTPERYDSVTTRPDQTVPDQTIPDQTISGTGFVALATPVTIGRQAPSAGAREKAGASDDAKATGGSTGNEKRGKIRAGGVPHMEAADLTDPLRLRTLHDTCVARGIARGGEGGFIDFVALAQYARRKGKSSVRMFSALLRDGRWSYIANADEDTAREILRGSE